MKHTLSTFRRSSALRILCLLVLALMCAPAAMAAASSAPVGLPVATGSHAGSAFLAAGLGGLMLLRSPAADDGRENGGGDNKPVDPAAAIAAIEDKTLPMSQRLGVALSALKGIAPAEQFAKVKTDLDAAQALLKTRDGELAAANKQIAALQADVTTLEESNAKLETANKELAAKEQDLDKRAKALAKEQVAALGFPASQLPPADPKINAAATDDEAMAEYAKITDPKAKAEYYAANIAPRLDRKN